MFSRRYFLILIFLGFSIHATEQQSSGFQFSLMHRIKDYFANKYGIEKYGTEPLMPEQEKFVRAIIQEMGITKHVEIRKMNRHALVTHGLYNAFAYNDTELVHSSEVAVPL